MPLSIILVNPEIPQNVGFIARSMKCYLLSDLKIIGKKYAPKSLAYKTGWTAREILQEAEHYKTLSEALTNIHYALGFTKRHRVEIPQRTSKLSETAASLDFSQNIALVFGRESHGLSKDDCNLMNKLVEIDVPNKDLSLNISHAVVIAMHEIFTHGLISGNPLVEKSEKLKKPNSLNTNDYMEPPPLSFGQRQIAFENFLDILRKKKVLRTEKTRAHLEYLRRLWQRASPDEKEMEFLLGLIHKIGKE